MKKATQAFQVGDFRAAEKLASKAADLKPNDPKVLQLMALAKGRLGKTRESISLLEKAIEQAPDDQQLILHLANALIVDGRASEAKDVLYTHYTDGASSAELALKLGQAHMDARQFDDALFQFREAARLVPSEPADLFELGRSLILFSAYGDALPILAEAARRGLRDPEVFNLIGTCCAALEYRDKAEQAYRMALTFDPKNIRAYVNLGLLLEQDNRLDDLASLVAEAEAKNIRSADIDYLLALLLQRDGKLDEALDLASRADPEFLETVLRDELVGKIADRLGKTGIAFEAFSKMNAGMSQRPEARGFNGSEYSQFIDARTKAVTPEWFARWSDAPPADGRPIPVILGGFLRSGTTLLDTILMGHPSVQVREEEAMIARLEDAGGDVADLADLSGDQITSLRDAYYGELERNGPVPHGQTLIDKYPLMTLRAAYVHRAFPDAKYIFALRHPCDVVLSCWMQNFRVTRAMASFLTLENAARLYDTTMTHWTRCQEVIPLNVHTIRYEDMVEDLEGQLRPLIDFIGLGWTDELLDHQQTAKDRGYIRTPSYAQVTEKVYSGSSGRWTKYREYLEPILPTLVPWIERFGYEPLDL